MHTGQAEDEEEVFHDSFQYQPPPGTVVSSSPGRDLARTPSSGQQNLTHSSSDDVAALTAAIERMLTEERSAGTANGGLALAGRASRFTTQECRAPETHPGATA